jgi:hypothetical protein
MVLAVSSDFCAKIAPKKSGLFQTPSSHISHVILRISRRLPTRFFVPLQYLLAAILVVAHGSRSEIANTRGRPAQEEAA